MTDEILAHISAPATRQTDNLYQSLVDAYYDFEPHRSLRDPDRADNTRLTPRRPPLSVPVTTRDGNAGITSTFITASSKDSFGSFPSHLSSDDHVSSYPQGASQVDRDSTEYGSVPTSSRLARLERIRQNWKEKTTPKSSLPKSIQTSRHHLLMQGDDDADDDADTAFIEDAQLAIQALQSQLDESHSTTSEDTSESDAGSEEYTGIFQVSDVPEIQHDVVANQVNDPSSPARAARPGVDSPVATRPILAVGTSVSSASINDNVDEQMQPLVQTTLAAEVHDFSKLPIDVFPPPPSISVSQPSRLPSQATLYLTLVKKRHPDRYHLVRRKYKPNDYDRGYWAVNCASWPVKAQLGFWSSLQDCLLNGKLGWGTTLHRTPKSSHEMGEVRLYCWGEVVEHMWLQLWLSSGGYVSFLEWHDADGITVLQARLKLKGTGTDTGSES
ncbi:hypothetical protein J1614_002822 [Plenodomus biglobosus]|nr:hypothetical protein J1614_002822 [Plenodomus biglobosus]